MKTEWRSRTGPELRAGDTLICGTGRFKLLNVEDGVQRVEWPDGRVSTWDSKTRPNANYMVEVEI